MTNTAHTPDSHCNVAKKRDLVSKMTECDQSVSNHTDQLDCYFKATKKSRESNDCLLD